MKIAEEKILPLINTTGLRFFIYTSTSFINFSMSEPTLKVELMDLRKLSNESFTSSIYAPVIKFSCCKIFFKTFKIKIYFF